MCWILSLRKSEMENNGDLRMEIEEDELRFYKVFHQGAIFKLQSIISEMFYQFEKQTSINANYDLNLL